MSPITPKPNNQELHKNHIKFLTPPTSTRWGNGVNKITAPILFILLLFSAIPVLAAQFQPIKEITEFEIKVITNVLKRPPDKDKIIAEIEEKYSEKIESFTTFRNVVVLRFQNGNEGYYYYGNAEKLEVSEKEISNQ